MQYIEIYKLYIKKYGSIDAVLKAGLYSIIDDDYIKKAFNFGRGEFKHFNEYMEANKKLCIFIKKGKK